MNEQTPQPDSDLQEALLESPRPAHKTPVATALARISLTQMTLAVLVVIFLWQWFDGHRAIGDMQQQLARKIAEMDGASKANQVLLTQSQGEVRELSAVVATLEARYAEAQNPVCSAWTGRRSTGCARPSARTWTSCAPCPAWTLPASISR